MSNSEFTVAGVRRYTITSPARWIISHLLAYPVLPAVIVVFAIGDAVLYSLTPVLVGRAFNLLSGDLEATEVILAALATTALLIAGVRIVHGVASLINAYAFEIVAKRFERDARDELVRSLLGKSQTFHNRQQVGDIMARATGDVRQLSSMVSPGLYLIVTAMLTLVAPVVAMGWLDYRLLFAPAVFTIAFYFALRRYTAQLNPVAIASRMQYGTMNADLAEAVSGIEVVKAYAQEGAEREKFNRDASAVRDLFVKEGDIRARYLPLLFFGFMYGAAFGQALMLYRRVRSRSARSWPIWACSACCASRPSSRSSPSRWCSSASPAPSVSLS